MFTFIKNRRLSGSVFFGLLLMLGLFLHRDYGVSWDEPIDHQNGAISGRYVAELLLPDLIRGNPTLATIPSLTNYGDNDHGVLFELPVAGLGMLFTHGAPQSYFFMRHLLIFLVFVAGVWVLYQLGCVYFSSWRLGLLGALFLILSPRIFAEAFFNGKDIPFMVCFMLGIYTLVRLLAHPTWGRAAIHALTTAAAIDIRVPGILLLASTAFMLTLDTIWPLTNRRPWLLLGLLYFILTGVFVIIGWPALWSNPIANFTQALLSLSYFTRWQATNYYLGQLVPASQLPWHYIPVWLISTTPIFYLVSALVGLATRLYVAYHVGWTWLRTSAGRLDLLLAGWLFGPIILVIIMRSVLYDGWRHLYFIYPALLLWVVRGVQVCLSFFATKHKAWQIGQVFFLVLALLHITSQMVRLHPYQHMYFSVLSSQQAERLMERDYWGLGFRQGLEWILRHDSSPQITISSSSTSPLYSNTLILSPSDRSRFQYRSRATARYFITNYRWHPQPYHDSVGAEVYFIRAGGVKIMSVFRR